VIHRTAALLLVTTIGAGQVAAQTMRSYSVERPLKGTQPTLLTTLDFGSGKVFLKAGGDTDLYKMSLHYDADRFSPVQQYDGRTGILKLGLRATGKSGIRVTSRGHLEQKAKFEFSPNVPISLTANLGASEAELDLGGLTLLDLTVRSGATKGVVDVSRPTQGNCREAVFYLGATELNATNLANAGCALVRVEGGMGRAVLGFGGSWRADTRVVANLAMGTLKLMVPNGTGVRVTADRFLTKLNIDGLERDESGWSTPGFRSAATKLTLELETKVAGVEVEWVD
jgi:hypothetical protein